MSSDRNQTGPGAAGQGTAPARRPRCPTCRGQVTARDENPAFPFCSHRCQLVDLGRWLDEDYRVPDRSLDGYDGASDETLAAPPEDDWQ
jgi:uncharacterized protein